MTPEMDLNGSSDSSPNPVVSDQNDVSILRVSCLLWPLIHRTYTQDLLATCFFNLGLPMFSDATLPQPAFWQAQPSPHPTDQRSSSSSLEIPSDTQTTEQSAFSFLPVTPGVPSIHPQSTVIPADDVAGNCNPCHGKVTGGDMASTSDMYFSVVVPAMPPVRSMYLVSSEIFSFQNNTAGSVYYYGCNLSS